MTKRRGTGSPRACSVAPLAIMWVIWKERNRRGSEDYVAFSV